MLHILHSNRLEILADRLSEVIRTPLSSPFAAEEILVQSNGMARWLTFHLASRLGVCANVRFPMPAAFVWRTYQAVLGDVVPEVSVFNPEVLVWRLMALLADLPDDRIYEPLRAYLGHGDDYDAYELAFRVADIFDQYLVYRPDWIKAWEAGEDAVQPWQSALWQRLSAKENPHRAALQRLFLETLNNKGLPPDFPGRLSIIGIPFMPPMYLTALINIARFVDVYLFMLNPCQEFWSDILAERDIGRKTRNLDVFALHLETGNPLLSSLGKQGQDFGRLLFDVSEHFLEQIIEDEHFEKPEGTSLFHILQADILKLRHRGTEDCPRHPIATDDYSVQIHACHSPLREVEVLHDRLLDLFQHDPTLSPADVVVMTPDIEDYAPAIEAVFAAAPRERYIPFTIADQGPRAQSPLIDTFFTLLELPGRRQDANEVIAPLYIAAVQRRFGLEEEDLETIRNWIKETSIRWGIDEDHRLFHGLPAFPEHTWRAGLSRLLLGYALPGDGARMFGGILPFPDIEGGATVTLGRFLAYLEALFSLDDRTKLEKRTILEWIYELNLILTNFFSPDQDEEQEVEKIRLAIKELGAAVELASFSRPTPLSVVRKALRRHLESGEDKAGRFLGGKVTICAMVPMRSIPFRVLCLIGMNDGSFPRPHRPPGFDLMAEDFRIGDRSRRDDDRYLFFEALLSAREVFYLSYVGASQRDNSIIPPSVLVSELLDTIRRGFFLSEDPDAEVTGRLVIRHPLQPFSPRYFNNEEGLFSYAAEWCRAAEYVARPSFTTKRFITTALPEPEPEWRLVSLDRLTSFLNHPSRFFSQHRLGIYLDRHEGIPDIREPFVLDPRSGRILRQNLLELALAGKEGDVAAALLRAQGLLPHGQVGRAICEEEEAAVAGFREKLKPLLSLTELSPLSLDINLGPFHLTGTLSQVFPAGLVGYQVARLGVWNYLRLWINHLALHLIKPAQVTLKSTWIAEDKSVVLGPVDTPEEYLRDLLDRYWSGLMRPLPFFPRSALAFLTAIQKGKTRYRALEKARATWEGDDYHLGESEDMYHRLIFRGIDPIDEAFTSEAEGILGPIFAHIV